MKSRIAAAVLAVLVVSSVSAQAEKWLSKAGADPDDRVLGHVSADDPNDFITCAKLHVKLSSIQGAVLKPANIGCPDSIGLDSADPEQQAEQERRTRNWSESGANGSAASSKNCKSRVAIQTMIRSPSPSWWSRRFNTNLTCQGSS